MTKKPINAVFAYTFFENDKLTISSVAILFFNQSFFFEGKSCIEDFLNLIFYFPLKQKKYTIYSNYLTHLGGLIIPYLDKFKIEKKNSILNKNNIYMLEFTINSRTIIFKCAFHYLPLKLKNVAMELRLELPSIYKNVDYYDKIIFCSHKIRTFIQRRNNIFSARIVQQLIERVFFLFSPYCEDVDFKTFSLSGLSFKIFNEKFNKNAQTSLSLHQDKIFRSAYFGGYNETVGNPHDQETVFYYDFPGMYANILLDFFPCGPLKISTSKADLEKKGYYLVDIESNNFHLPILPHHRPKDNKLMFCNGQWTGLYWGENLIDFVEKGGKIKKIHTAYTFDQYEPIFREFAETFLSLRASDLRNNKICKFFINTLPGRLGMGWKDYKDIICFRPELNQYDIKIIRNQTEINDVIILQLDQQSSKLNLHDDYVFLKSNVFLAAVITSKARLKLHKAFDDIIKNGGRILYSDTDSVAAAYTRNVVGETHGNIKWTEEHRLDDAVFCAPKIYGFIKNGKPTIHIKGVPAKHVTFNELKHNFFNNSSLLFPFFIKKNTSYIFTLQNIVRQVDLSSNDKRKFNETKTDSTPFYYINGEYV